MLLRIPGRAESPGYVGLDRSVSSCPYQLKTPSSEPRPFFIPHSSDKTSPLGHAWYTSSTGLTASRNQDSSSTTTYSSIRPY